MKKNNISNIFNNPSEVKVQNFETDSIKTTNINILLNRVRKKRNTEIKKKIIFSSSLIILISFVGAVVLF